ncbi:MAG: CBS domain-containing protein [Bacteroidota bacterium]
MQQLLTDIKAMERMLDDGLFETGIRRIGLEQELCFVNKNWRPAPRVMKILEAIDDPHFTTELARFNMEINLDPELFTGSVLSTVQAKLDHFMAIAENAAQQFDAHAILCGIVPSINRRDVDIRNLTPLPRYKMLTDLIHELRGDSMEFRIEGADQLIVKEASALFEGSNTSFQVHYQVWPEEFASLYNWSEAITAPLMAVSTNSPIFLGRRLWRETRIALFEQSVDIRNQSEIRRSKMPRVSFGNDWLQNSVLEIYRESVVRHKPLLQSTVHEDPMALLDQGLTPKLYALNIHNGTLWSWNRACYGLTNGIPHLRIENRVLPAGPTRVDEIANAAFWLGMMHGMPEKYTNINDKMEFDEAKLNFLKAARQGLGAQFVWPGYDYKITAQELILRELLPIAQKGLEKAHIDPQDIDKYLTIIEQRAVSGNTGSQWILDSFNNLKKEGTREEALLATTAGLHKRQQEGSPVHNWKLAQMTEVGGWNKRFASVCQLMSTDLFTVNEDDLIDFVTSIMDWENIRHVPVENDAGQLVGLVSSKMLIRYYSQKDPNADPVAVGDLMTKELFTVAPDTPTHTAIAIMRDQGIASLPVVQKGKLVGIVTEKDFLKAVSFCLEEIEKSESSTTLVAEQS